MTPPRPLCLHLPLTCVCVRPQHFRGISRCIWHGSGGYLAQTRGRVWLVVAGYVRFSST